MADPDTKGMISGVLPMRLANAVSDAINAALRSGMETDEAVAVATAVLVDYWRDTYGPERARQAFDTTVSWRLTQPMLEDHHG